MTTPRDLVMLALKLSGSVGIGQDPLPEDVNDAFTQLNLILAQWNRKRWMLYHMLDVAFVSTGAQSYSVGPAGDFVMDRPERVDDAYLRFINQANPYQADYPLTMIAAREDYAGIVLKNQPGFPQVAFYDAGYPTGTLYLWPVPQADVYEIHLIVKAQLTAFTSLDQDINLPDEYAEAFLYTLADRLRPAYQMPPDPTLVALASAAQTVVKNANADIPLMQLDGALSHANGGYNIFSDGYGIRQ